jgi:hypothetical protein
MSAAALPVALVLIGAAIALLFAAMRAGGTVRRARDEGEGPGGGGGGNLRRRPRPRPPSDSGDPPWWPEFEREFRDYVARPAFEHRPRDARPAFDG